MSALRQLYRSENNWDFTRAWRIGLIVSAVLIVVSLGSLALRGLNLGIDFEGGVAWEVKAPGVAEGDVRAALSDTGIVDPRVQFLGGDTLRVQAGVLPAEQQEAARNALAGLVGVDREQVSVYEVGPSWGQEVTAAALRALVVFFLAVAAFITLRYEWRMAVGALVAVAHDVVISIGIYSIFQFTVTPGTLIAFLTIMGFSLYDTIVVYDKVEQNKGLVSGGKITYTALINRSMNEVLMRSINTSLTSILPVLSMLVIGAGIMGANTLAEFGIALFVGLATGAYSSVFIAAPVLAWLGEREHRNVEIRHRLERQSASSGEDLLSPTAALPLVVAATERERTGGRTAATPRRPVPAGRTRRPAGSGESPGTTATAVAERPDGDAPAKPASGAGSAAPAAPPKPKPKTAGAGPSGGGSRPPSGSGPVTPRPRKKKRR